MIQSKIFPIQQFINEKMGDAKISTNFREKLDDDLTELGSLLQKMLKFNSYSIQLYNEFMQKSIEQVKTYFNETELMKLHQRSINDSLAQVIQ